MNGDDATVTAIRIRPEYDPFVFGFCVQLADALGLDSISDHAGGRMLQFGLGVFRFMLKTSQKIL